MVELETYGGPIPQQKTKFQKWRFKEYKKSAFKGYVVDRMIFLVGMIFVVLLFGFVANHYNWDFSKQLYIKCDGLPNCQNPIFGHKACKNLDWCFNETLPYGFQYGMPPDNWLKNCQYGMFGIILAAFIINHLIYNRKFNLEKNMKEIESNETNKHDKQN